MLLGGLGLSAAVRVQALRGEIDAERRTIGELESRVRQLRETVDRLHNDPEYVEKIAREEHGLARPGETILKFPARTP